MYAAHEESERLRMPVDEVLGRSGEADRRTRREVLVGAGGLAAGAALARSPAAALAFRIAKLQAHPRIAIVGGGLAGLRCAHLLWTGRAGDPTDRDAVYEANARARRRALLDAAGLLRGRADRARRIVPRTPTTAPCAGSRRVLGLQTGGGQRR